MIPLPQVPTYDEVLPVSKTKVKFRPFLVKEEKIFLLANSDVNNSKEIFSAVKQILENCTFGMVDISKLPMVDVEWLFVQIRKRSIGETIASTVECMECKAKIDYPIDLNSMDIINEVKDNNISVANDTIITMKYPTLELTDGLESYDEVDVPVAIIANMISMITIKDTVYDAQDFKRDELIVWLENLTQKQAGLLEEFILKLPKLAYADKIKCQCGADINIYMEGLENFFV